MYEWVDLRKGNFFWNVVDPNHAKSAFQVSDIL